MKVFKKMMVLFVSLGLVFSMMTKSSALTGELILNTGAYDVSGVDFKAYKLFNATVSGGNTAYTVSTGFITFYATKLGLDPLLNLNFNKAAYDYTQAHISDPQFVADLKAYILINPVTTLTKTISGVLGSVTQSFGSLDYGYYCVIPSSASLSVSFTSLVSASLTIGLKGATPTVTKKVENADWTSAQVGDVVTFKVSSMIPDMGSNTSYYFKMTDIMSTGLTLSAGTLNMKVTVNGRTLTNITDYTMQISGQNLTVDINNFINYKADVNQAIVFEYNATVNQSSVGVSMNNTANVHYGANLESLTDAVADSVYLHNYPLTITKTDNMVTPLANAHFEIYRGIDVTNMSSKLNLIDLGSSEYRIAMPGETGTTTTVISPSNGIIKVYGLDEGQYQLVETMAPDGYNALTEPYSVNISASSLNGGQTVAVTGNTPIVQNSTGTTLPETGGMGTLLFTVVGAGGLLLVLASIVFNKKKEEQ